MIEICCSRKLEEIFGYGITGQRPGGANFYQRSYVLGERMGMVCHGGQRKTILVSISGTGCTGAKPGWEKRLHDFLDAEPTAKITRIDLAFDDFEGVHNIDQIPVWWDEGGFNCGGRNPDIEQRGNWRSPNGKGRTVYVGHRDNGKYFRGYEKGKHLGDKESPWIRFEGEMKSVDRVLPIDILLRAGEYLAAMYPCLAFINEKQERIKTTQKTLEISYAKMCEWLHLQCGRAIWAMSEIEGSAEAVLQKIMRVGQLPSRLSIPDWCHAGEFLHNAKRATQPIDAAIEQAFAS